MERMRNHRNRVLFKKIQPNPFLVSEKATLVFQKNLQIVIGDSYLHNKWHKVLSMVEKWIRYIPPINGIFKLNFDGLRIQNRSSSRMVIRDSNGTIKMATSKHLGNTSIIIAECMG